MYAAKRLILARPHRAAMRTASPDIPLYQIRALEGDYEVQIDIEEDGTILVYATEGTKADAAISAITALTKEAEVGDTYTGKVVKTTQFGAFVELKKGTDGLLHVSNVAAASPANRVKTLVIG